MPFDAKVFRVMIASPSDVKDARGIIREVLAEWNAIHSSTRSLVLLPLGWETHSSPSMGDRPQAIINKQVLKEADLLIGVFWTRIGTATGEFQSGTVEEIEEHISSGKPAMLYFSDEPVRPDSVDPNQYAALRAFKDGCKARSLWETYSDPVEFREKFSRQLQLKLNEDDYFGPVDFSQTPSAMPRVSLSREALTLLKEAAKSPNGEIRFHRLIGGVMLLANGKNYGKDTTPRERAAWEAGLEELENLGLVKATSFERHHFQVTRDGYAFTEQLDEARGQELEEKA